MPGEIVVGALKHIWVHLEPFHLPRAIMGGLSLALWDHIRATQDVDLLVDFGSADVAGILQTLERAGIRSKHQPPILTIGPVRILQLLYEPPGVFVEIQIDLLFAESDFQRQAITRRVAAQLPGLDFEIFVLSCEDIIIFKLIASRVIDQADAAALLRINRAHLDFTYLQDWIGRLALTAEWAEIWDEAFPGEPLPAEV
jgi:hypothetical protein